MTARPAETTADVPAREAALRDVLQVIRDSRDDETPVFELILTHARQLCEAPLAGLVLGQPGDAYLTFAAEYGVDEATVEFFRQGQALMDPEKSFAARAILGGNLIHLADMKDTEEYRAGYLTVTSMVDLQGIKTVLFVPLMTADGGIGVITLFRQEVRPFTDSQIALVETFAEQAVIAIENVRQFREVQTRLEREEASREILQVISNSRTDTAPVFETILKNAARLCDAQSAGLHLVNEARTHTRLMGGWGLDHGTFQIGEEFELGVALAVTTAIQEARVVHIADLATSSLYIARNPVRVRMVEEEGLRVFLVVPLISESVAFGCINLSRRKTQPFSDSDIALIETFAEQAVIAIENVRQFREVQTRLVREEAMRDILQVISRSRNDEAPVFELILTHARQLCEAPLAALVLGRAGGSLQTLVAEHGSEETTKNLYNEGRVSMDPEKSFAARAILDGRVIHLADMADTEEYRVGATTVTSMVDGQGIRTVLFVPLMAEGAGIGALVLFRQDVRPFTDSQIALVETFAEQAVIAIENVRQFKALEQLNAELGDRVDEQVDEIERVGRLKRFLPSAVADTVMSTGSEEMLKSHRAMIATLFCDIRGFTAFCESAEPEETIEVLQTFHETLGKLIDEAGAGFDHRAGDGIMVVFNDPVPCDDPARAALRVAIAMREVMVDLCAKWRKLGHRMGFGVGISLGYATVGMVGFEGRYDYTANGTVVNLASRLCDQAMDQEILISQRAATALEDYATVESAGELTLKGFHAPVDVCRVIDVKETL